MKVPRDALAYLQAAAAGAGTWLLTVWVGRTAEGWGGPLYFGLGLPLLAGIVALLGYRHPRHAWRWGATAALAQALLLVASVGVRSPRLWTGLVQLCVVGLALAGLALAGARLRRSRAG